MAALQRPSGVVIGHVASFTKSLISTITTYSSPLKSPRPTVDEAGEPRLPHPPVDPLFANHKRFDAVDPEPPRSLSTLMTTLAPSRTLKHLLFYALLLPLVLPLAALWELYLVSFGGPFPDDSFDPEADDDPWRTGGRFWRHSAVLRYLLASLAEVAGGLGAVALALAVADEHFLSAGTLAQVRRMQAGFAPTLDALGGRAAGLVARMLAGLTRAVLFGGLLIGGLAFYALRAVTMAVFRTLGLGCLFGLLVVPAAGLAQPVVKPLLQSMEAVRRGLLAVGAGMTKAHGGDETPLQGMEMMERKDHAQSKNNDESSGEDKEYEMALEDQNEDEDSLIQAPDETILLKWEFNHRRRPLRRGPTVKRGRPLAKRGLSQL